MLTGTFGIWSWITLLAVMAVIFGNKKLRNVGVALGIAVESVKSALRRKRLGTRCELTAAQAGLEPVE